MIKKPIDRLRTTQIDLTTYLRLEPSSQYASLDRFNLDYHNGKLIVLDFPRSFDLNVANQYQVLQIDGAAFPPKAPAQED